MTIAHAMLAEFDQECRATRACLERVPADKFDWRPHERSMTLGQLAGHIAVLPGGMLKAAQYDDFTGEQLSDLVPYPTTHDQILPVHDASVATVHELLPQFSDERMLALWSFSFRGQQILSVPRAAMLRSFLLNHWLHHRGQLTVFMRLLDIPVPSIYGPSADDNPFA
jgi:uncharacterized damage-inducible protein DinB